ncbi:glycosyltransferase, partial [Mycolicibacterium sp. CBMA 361]|uniref:glycosyltransferase n=1 Tax=Mycolicibacterium sp. CBMA 361 TaxID=2606610 RepID=UPI001396C95B|nr:glycosyltransferase family 2 protein [Mycolicibacterium sp. CBMA 361]
MTEQPSGSTPDRPLLVVTVTYSPGSHLDRFLATLAHATDRRLLVVMADNGSTDGAPEAALERYADVELFRTGGNLGYGTAVNRAVAAYLDTPDSIVDPDFFMVVNPDVLWGPHSIDELFAGAQRWPDAGAVWSIRMCCGGRTALMSCSRVRSGGRTPVR